jgi:CheY-like chemotaxis protein
LADGPVPRGSQAFNSYYGGKVPTIHRLPRIVRSNDIAKPRVLLVDDHPGVLDRVAALLENDFHVVGTASDGRQALDSLRHIDPDAIVLDINMPGLDGFQTMRALEQAGSRAPVVFLSLLHTEELVSEALRCGGQGYVVKSLMTRDLASALDQVLLGRRFVPSLTPLLELAPLTGHAMQIHSDIDTFIDGLAAFFDQALRRGDATCVIAQARVRDGLEDRLRVRGWDVGGPAGHKRYLAIDVHGALRGFMRNGLPDAFLMSELASELDRYRGAVAEDATSRLTIFGNMVVPLLAAGNAQAAMALESIWNRVTHDLPFFTLCGYPASCFSPDEPDLWDRACAEHSAVSPASDL